MVASANWAVYPNCTGSGSHKGLFNFVVYIYQPLNNLSHKQSKLLLYNEAFGSKVL